MIDMPNETTKRKKRGLRMALLASLCTVAFASVAAMPIAIDGHGGTFKVAYAKNDGKGGGNGGGNAGGNGGGNADAPGQQKKLADDESAAEEDALTSTVEGPVAEGGEEAPTVILPIAEDAEPASNKVIKELAGLPEQSELSDDEEQEAIQSGWGTWRTADGPETVITQ